MILMLHILAAIAGVGASTYAYIWPSRRAVYGSAFLALGTLASGSYLVIASGTSIVHACVSGIIYFGIVTGLLVLSVRKLSVSM